MNMKRVGLAVVAVLALFLFSGAVTPNSFVTPQTPTLGLQNFVQGTDAAGTFKTVYTGGANGSKCFSLTVTSSDGSATHLITARITRSAVSYTTAAATIATGAGTTAGVPPLVLMAPAVWSGLPYDSDSNTFIYLQSGDTLQVTFATALTSSTSLFVMALCADF